MWAVQSGNFFEIVGIGVRSALMTLGKVELYGPAGFTPQKREMLVDQIQRLVAPVTL